MGLEGVRGHVRVVAPQTLSERGAHSKVEAYSVLDFRFVKSSPFDLVPDESVVGGRADENTAKADAGARTSAMPLTTDQIDGEPFSLLLIWFVFGTGILVST